MQTRLLLIFFFSIFIYNLNRQTHPHSFQLDLDCGFSEDFTTFLNENGYASFKFDRPDIKCAAYGGKQNQQEKIDQFPVIFIHGNSDIGFGRGKIDGNQNWQTGFRSLATYFTQQGYKKGELYTTTWGPANIDLSSTLYHKKQFVMAMRAFVEAVLAYTKAQKVNILSHSMGVTIARQVAKGGVAIDHVAGSYFVGESLKQKIHSFVGIAGGNLGLTSCWNTEILPACNLKDGFFPGSTSISPPSEYLNDLNKKGGAQGANVYTIWSKYDQVILYECVVWGKVTCRIPDQTDEVIKTSIEWTHLAIRDNTGPDMINWLQKPNIVAQK